jgi:diguanylate cyclase (GGDEF)-like protein
MEGPPLRVLVVDDDPDALTAVAQALEDLGHRVTPALGGEAAIAAFESDGFDVVLSDWLMPGVTGLDLCRRVRASLQGQYTYFIFLTGLDDKRHLLEGMRSGADDYLTKPIDLDELEVRLIAAGRVQALHRQLAAQNAALRKDSDAAFRAARIDPLTSTGNRRAMEEHLELIATRGKEDTYTVALVDVDHFKAYNDHFGHLAGDQALKRLADVLREHLRRQDALYRFGGEEFLVVLSGQRLGEARTAMERVRASVERIGIAHVPGASPTGVVTVSIGLAERVAGAGIEPWLTRADRALYRAKSRGRNRIEVDEVS